VNISKLTENQLITKKTHTMLWSHSPSGAYSHRHCLVTFNLTQLLFLADHDRPIMTLYCYLLYLDYRTHHCQTCEGGGMRPRRRRPLLWCWRVKLLIELQQERTEHCHQALLTSAQLLQHYYYHYYHHLDFSVAWVTKVIAKSRPTC